MPTLLVACLLLAEAGIPPGDARLDVDVGATRLEVFTYKPPHYRDGPLLFVFHGVLRNADVYRDHARAMGDRFGMVVVAPRFDERRFGPGMYQQGGLYRDGRIAPRADWSWSFVPKL